MVENKPYLCYLDRDQPGVCVGQINILYFDAYPKYQQHQETNTTHSQYSHYRGKKLLQSRDIQSIFFSAWMIWLRVRCFSNFSSKKWLILSEWLPHSEVQHTQWPSGPSGPSGRRPLSPYEPCTSRPTSVSFRLPLGHSEPAARLRFPGTNGNSLKPWLIERCLQTNVKLHQFLVITSSLFDHENHENWKMNGIWMGIVDHKTCISIDQIATKSHQTASRCPQFQQLQAILFNLPRCKASSGFCLHGQSHQIKLASNCDPSDVLLDEVLATTGTPMNMRIQASFPDNGGCPHPQCSCWRRLSVSNPEKDTRKNQHPISSTSVNFIGKRKTFFCKKNTQ